MMTGRIGLAGLGLIGGSLGLSFTASGRFAAVIGYDSDPRVAEAALASGAITGIAASLPELAGVDLIFVATPVPAVAPTIAALTPHLRPGMIITDTASTKAEVVAAARASLPEGVFFVGGHPFAGSERAGLAAADPYLFENAAYVLTSEPPVPDRVRRELAEVIAITGAKTILLSPADHDLVAAAISHLPHLAAVALVNTLAGLGPAQPAALTLAGGGFRDTTRIAGGDASLWAGILGTNRAPLLSLMGLFAAEMDKLASGLAPGRQEELEALLASARMMREEVPARGKGLLGKVEELVVAVQDRPGAIKQILDVLAAEAINIKDIEILRLREGEGGTLRLAVEDEPTLARAVDILNSAGMRAKKR